MLSDYQDDLGITRLSNAIDWGWIEFFEVPILKLLDWLFTQVGNFGLAIMILTLLISAALFQIAQRQFHSIAQLDRKQLVLRKSVLVSLDPGVRPIIKT